MKSDISIFGTYLLGYAVGLFGVIFGLFILFANALIGLIIIILSLIIGKFLIFKAKRHRGIKVYNGGYLK